MTTPYCDFTMCDREADHYIPSGRRFCKQHLEDLVTFAMVSEAEVRSYNGGKCE